MMDGLPADKIVLYPDLNWVTVPPDLVEYPYGP